MVGTARERTRSETRLARDELTRLRLACRGAVQGVGFRPAVYRLAVSLELTGTVRNDADGATIEVEGTRVLVERFRERLEPALPPLARLEAVSVTDLAPEHSVEFVVDASQLTARRRALVPPDAGLCDDCRAEQDDPNDRRYRYPFTTCTNCGPRFTLVRALPYDRSRTSMSDFPLCEACAREYANPLDRRFHAEPLCCPACGPELRLVDRSGTLLGSDQRALELVREQLARGAVVAVKGLGGYQLACRAADAAAVARLRAAKRRPSKPFALMVRDLDAARSIVRLRPTDQDLLCSVRAPIVLAPRRSRRLVDEGVAPGLADLGVMLPTSSLHVELFRDAPYAALVMTSGNASDEPICRTETDAVQRLHALADFSLEHEREVVRRADDSVVRTLPRGHVLLRRSRGWVPEPLPLPEHAAEPVLALGGHLQNTACLATGSEAFLSQHVGDLDTLLAREFLLEVADGLEDFLQSSAKIIAIDEHPDYPSSLLGEHLAAARGARLVRVQHHLAHAAAVLGEHERFPALDERAAAVVLDGTGFGSDGTAWGCELLMIDGTLDWQRLGHGSEFALVGGERAVRQPWRVATAALAGAGHADLLEHTPLAEFVALDRIRLVARLADDPHWLRATGAGRVFEAAGALFGLVTENSYEGEAAARLESLAGSYRGAPEVWTEAELRVNELDTDRLLVAAARRLAAGAQPLDELAAGFHTTFCRMLAHYVAHRLPEGVRTVALGGGCFANRLLADGIGAELLEYGLDPLLPRAVPPGDGGLAYGQALIATMAATRAQLPNYLGES